MKTFCTSPYPAEVAHTLNRLTGEFYAREAETFSATRQMPWKGWEQSFELIEQEDSTFFSHPLTIVDIACGNLRFESFLCECHITPRHIYAVDSCPALADKSPFGSLHTSPSATCLGKNCTAPLSHTLEYHEVDIVEALDGKNLSFELPCATADLAVVFGFMHHLPHFPQRAEMLKVLGKTLRPGGFAIVSFWQFLNDDRLAAKAKLTTTSALNRLKLGALHKGDYLLGWQHAENIYRFCHHTSEEEIDALLTSANISPSHSSTKEETLREIARFSADGKQGNLNRYLILQKMK